MLACLVALASFPLAADPPAFRYEVHDPMRPLPPVVDPGPARPPVAPPSDAVVLLPLAGGDLSAWRGGDGGPPKWTLADGVMTVTPGTGDLRTAADFADCQLHLEWMVPADRKVEGQMGGNSGVFLMDRYELQILSVHGNRTYADGMAGALYGQYPPLANPCRPQGEWNTFDVVFRAPRFRPDGSLESPARLTAFFNGVLVQDDAELLGTTAHRARASYAAHGPGPIRLQDHGDPIRFRNIWVRPLAPRSPPE
jgi:hypothetical protein